MGRFSQTGIYGIKKKKKSNGMSWDLGRSYFSFSDLKWLSWFKVPHVHSSARKLIYFSIRSEDLIQTQQNHANVG